MKDTFKPGKSGYHGKDVLRSKAEKAFSHEIHAARANPPESMSSPGHTKLRKFADGGTASWGQPLKNQARLAPGLNPNATQHGWSEWEGVPGRRSSGVPTFGRGFNSGGNAKAKGGNMHEYRHGGATHTKMNGECPVNRKASGGALNKASGGTAKMGWGGSLLGMTSPAAGMANALGAFGDFAKGGHSHKRSHKHRAAGGKAFAEGGHAAGGTLRRGGSASHAVNHDQSDMHIPTYNKSPRIKTQSFHEAAVAKKGGRIKGKKFDIGGETGPFPPTTMPAQTAQAAPAAQAQPQQQQGFKAQPYTGTPLPTYKKGGKTKKMSWGGDLFNRAKAWAYPGQAAPAATPQQAPAQPGQRVTPEDWQARGAAALKGQPAYKKGGKPKYEGGGIVYNNPSAMKARQVQRVDNIIAQGKARQQQQADAAAAARKSQAQAEAGRPVYGAKGGEMKKGGHKHKAAGGSAYAAGGVAKIRHKQANAAGKPITPPHKRFGK